MNKLNTIFFEAVENGDYNRVKKCIEDGADVNYSKTALYYASRCDHNDIVKLLFESGADVNTKNKKKPIEWTIVNYKKRKTQPTRVKR